MREIVDRLHENRQIDLAKSLLESNGYKVSKKLRESDDEYVESIRVGIPDNLLRHLKNKTISVSTLEDILRDWNYATKSSTILVDLKSKSMDLLRPNIEFYGEDIEDDLYQWLEDYGATLEEANGCTVTQKKLKESKRPRVSKDRRVRESVEKSYTWSREWGYAGGGPREKYYDSSEEDIFGVIYEPDDSLDSYATAIWDGDDYSNGEDPINAEVGFDTEAEAKKWVERWTRHYLSLEKPRKWITYYLKCKYSIPDSEDRKVILRKLRTKINRLSKDFMYSGFCASDRTVKGKDPDETVCVFTVTFGSDRDPREVRNLISKVSQVMEKWEFFEYWVEQPDLSDYPG